MSTDNQLRKQTSIFTVICFNWRTHLTNNVTSRAK